MADLPFNKGAKAIPGCSVDPFFKANKTINYIENIELIEAAFGKGEVDQIAIFSARVQTQGKNKDIIIKLQKLQSGQIRICSLNFERMSGDKQKGGRLYEMNMHFVGDGHEKFKRWLENENIPFSTHISDGTEYVSWDKRYSHRIQNWPYFPPGHWKSKGVEPLKK